MVYESNGAGNYDLDGCHGQRKKSCTAESIFPLRLIRMGHIEKYNFQRKLLRCKFAANDTGAILLMPHMHCIKHQTGTYVMEQSEFFLIENISQTGRRTYMLIRVF
jgi:hypothetical protein